MDSMDLTKRSLSKGLIYLYFLDNMDIEKIVWKISSIFYFKKKNFQIALS